MESNNIERVVIKQTEKILDVNEAKLNDSAFSMIMMNNARFSGVCMQGLKISDANLSDLEINGAQLGGAYIHNIGMPPKGHPGYNENNQQRPLRFEDCDLRGTTITDCNLSGVSITDCNTAGMTVNGILIDDLLAAYHKR